MKTKQSTSLVRFNLLVIALLVVGTHSFLFGQKYKNDYERVLKSSEYTYGEYAVLDAVYRASKAKNDTMYMRLAEERMDEWVWEIEKIRRLNKLVLEEPTQKLLEAVYFYNNRFGLAYNGKKYGFIYKDGRVAIQCIYDEATNFDKKHGYARVKRDGKEYWLDYMKNEYDGNLAIKDLPKGGGDYYDYRKSEFSNLNKIYRWKFESGESTDEAWKKVKTFEQNIQYYEMYLELSKERVKAKKYNDEKAITHIDKIKSRVVQHLNFIRFQYGAKKRNQKKIMDQLYFYRDRYKVTITKGTYNEYHYFLDKKTKGIAEHLGQWSYARDFDKYGCAYVEKDGEKLMLTPDGKTYKAAYSIEEIDEHTEAIDLSGLELSVFPQEIFKAKHLKILNISSTQITDLPVALIDSCTQLRDLYIASTKIKSLPKEIEKLPIERLSLTEELAEIPWSTIYSFDLTYLNIKECDIEELPKGIGKCKRMEELKLPSTLRVLPDDLCELDRLEELNLYYTKIVNLPARFFELNLKKVDLPKTLEVLPRGMERIMTTEKLDLSFTMLKTLPKGLGAANITALLLPLSFEELPADIGEYSTLKVLDLRETKVSSLPKGIVNSNITTLRLSKHFSVQPEGLEQLDSLQVLDLIETKIKVLSERFGEMKNLRELILSPSLESLPSTFGQLSQLGMLNLRGTKIKELPNGFGQLKVRHLVLPTGLKTLSPDFGELAFVRVVDLKHTAVEVLPEGFGQMESLRRLILPSTIKQLSADFGQLPALIMLDLSETKMVELPEGLGTLKIGELVLPPTLEKLSADIGGMENLRELVVPATYDVLPSSILSLKSLAVLDLRKTSIKKLPKKFEQLSNLEYVDLPTTLEEFPVSMKTFTKMRAFDAQKTVLTELPSEGWASLTDLEVLKIPSTVKKLPNSLLNAKFDKLTTLNLGGAVLDSLPVIYDVAKLEKIEMSVATIKQDTLDFSAHTSLSGFRLSVEQYCKAKMKIQGRAVVKLGPASIEEIKTNIEGLKKGTITSIIIDGKIDGDVSFLSELTNIGRVEIHRENEADKKREEVDRIKKALPRCRVIYCSCSRNK